MIDEGKTEKKSQKKGGFWKQVSVWLLQLHPNCQAIAHWKLHFNNPPQILLPETLIPPQITNPQILIRRDSLSPRRRGSKKSHPTALTPPSSSSKKNPSGPPKQTKPRAPPLFPTKSPTLTTLKRAMLETVQRVRLVLHQKEESMQEECTRPQRARVP
ncbi:mannose-1-phosphate guanyltransferase alpha [Striga asiatica]|uniref:Mannose-1-phosphate guanyltransferase alpha n=1 Tax=Striga asiatica TaxID=4170 RepID=A0A5A7R1T2_STRAF|nr:mannose-1-phosphate guanyltransferase alpha [Striga asiatica]